MHYKVLPQCYVFWMWSIWNYILRRTLLQIIEIFPMFVCRYINWHNKCTQWFPMNCVQVLQIIKKIWPVCGLNLCKNRRTRTQWVPHSDFNGWQTKGKYLIAILLSVRMSFHIKLSIYSLHYCHCIGEHFVKKWIVFPAFERFFVFSLFRLWISSTIRNNTSDCMQWAGIICSMIEIGNLMSTRKMCDCWNCLTRCVQVSRSLLPSRSRFTCRSHSVCLFAPLYCACQCEIRRAAPYVVNEMNCKRVQMEL